MAADGLEVEEPAAGEEQAAAAEEEPFGKEGEAGEAAGARRDCWQGEDNLPG